MQPTSPTTELRCTPAVGLDAAFRSTRGVCRESPCQRHTRTSAHCPIPRQQLTFDQPEIQQVRRDALAWWIGQLGDALVCLTTLALDESRYGGAITVTRAPVAFHDDPFARIFPGTVVRSDVFCSVAPPTGPVVERYAGVPWPGGTFAAL